jgi:integral membrane protein
MTNELNNKTLNLLLKVGFAEGVSFLILLFIAMPLKYFMNMPLPVKIVGMLHGVLFVSFVIILLKATWEYKWKLKTAAIGLLLSFLPFGTFYLDRILKNKKSE